MLPIPVQIIGSNKRLFIPFLYLVVTTTLCYLFLVAVIDTTVSHQTTSQPKSLTYTSHKNNKFWQLKSVTDSHILLVPIRSTEKHTGILVEQEQDPLLLPVTERFQRSVSSLRGKSYPPRKNKHPENGTRRSNPTQVWSGHQDNLWIDQLAPVYYPWPHDKQCKIFAVRFAKKKTFKPRALVSFPGSGNSWLRYLIECSTGIFTGSAYDDKSLIRSGLLGELRPPNDGSTIVQKTHHDTTYFFTNSIAAKGFIKLSELVFGYRGILLIRNPYDAILSYWNYKHTRDHIGYAKEINSSDISKASIPFLRNVVFVMYRNYFVEWTNYVAAAAKQWSSLIMTWVENSLDLLIVQYEELKKNPREELLRILKYLEQPVNVERLDCLLKKEHLVGPFHRQHNNNKMSQQQGNSTESIQTQDSSARKSIFSNNHQHPPLDLILQDNIHKINLFFRQKGISIQLNYTAAS